MSSATTATALCGTPGCRCGCRLTAFDAEQVKRRVYAEAQRIAVGIARTPTDRLAALAHQLFTRVSLGATADDIAFTPRTQKRSRP
ncbi:MAG TPA: hypothetical protein VFZ32_04915 [Micromonosporaceae bacterium]